MSEDIKDIKEILELAKDEIENNNENITATLDLQDLKSLKSLYDLYNKEKEKNKILDNMLLVNKEQYEFIKNKDNYISKDKIKDEVEYIRFMVDDDNKSSEIVKEVNLYLDLFLQELLEERN